MFVYFDHKFGHKPGMRFLIILFWSLSVNATTNGVYETFRSYCTPINLKTNRLINTISFFQSSLVSKRITFKAALVENKLGQIIKAPIVYIVPGSFSELHDDQAQNMLNLLNNQGYHAVIFPHPWSPTVVQARLNYAPGDLEKESSLMVAMIRFVQKNYDEFILPEQESLLGISSGGTLALALATKFKQKTFKRVILMSPPIDLSYSINVIDKMYAEVDQLARSINVVSLYKAYKGICSSYALEDYTLATQYPYFSDVTKAILSYFVFVREFQKMLLNLDNYSSFSSDLPYDGFINHPLLRFPIHYNMVKAYERKFPKVYADIKNRTGRLSYWLPLVENVQIVTAENDPINDGISWDGVSDLAEEFIALKSGGHFGFRNEIFPRIFPAYHLITQ